MKRTLLSIALVAFVSLGAISCKDKGEEAKTTTEKEVVEAPAEAVSYAVDIANSQITWKGSKPLGSHNGTIALSGGKLAIKGDVIEAGEFVIDMNSITDLDLEGGMKENLEAHLKGTVEGKEGDFFDVTKYPTATFALTGIEEVDGKTMMNGNLTIKEKTNNISFPVDISSEGNTMTVTSETFVIDRTKWDVNYGSKTVFDNLGDKFVSDDVEITVTLVANMAN